MDNSKDHLECRCPKLGGPVDFKYCRTIGENALPCYRTTTCWWERFDITDYLRNNLSENNFSTLTQTLPKPKISNLLELIQEAQNRSKGEKK